MELEEDSVKEFEDVEDVWEEAGILLDDADEAMESVEELVLDEASVVNELSVGLSEDGFTTFGSSKNEELEVLKKAEELAESLLEELAFDDCTPALGETGSWVIPLHSEVLPSPPYCVLCKPTSTMFIELLLSEVSDIAQPFSRSIAAKTAAINLVFILFSPFF